MPRQNRDKRCESLDAVEAGMAIGVLCEKQCYAGKEVVAFVGKQSDLDKLHVATSPKWTRARRKRNPR